MTLVFPGKNSHWCHGPAAWKTVVFRPNLISSERSKRYCGKDLGKFDDIRTTELLADIKKLLPARTYERFFDFRPWYLWEFPTQKAQSFYLLFEVDNSGPHPGSTKIRITEFDTKGQVTSETAFRTGHRCYLRRVTLETTLLEGEYPIIILETGPGGGPGPDIYRQYYANVGGRYDLIRLEDYDGKGTRNGYYVRHFQSGPALPKQTEVNWKTDVLSSDRGRLLRALVWLGGRHYDLKPGDNPGNQDEAVEDAMLVRKVRENKQVIDRLKELVESSDRWVREAARLASKPEDGRF